MTSGESQKEFLNRPFPMKSLGEAMSRLSMWDEVKQNQSRRLMVAADRCTGKTSAIVEMVLADTVDAVVVTYSAYNAAKVDNKFYERGVGQRRVRVVDPRTYRNAQMQRVYDLYIDEPWHTKHLDEIVQYFLDARRIIMIGTPDNSDDGTKSVATSLWFSGEWECLMPGRIAVKPPLGKTMSERVVDAITGVADEINRHRYADITVKVQDGRVVMTEITAKFKS